MGDVYLTSEELTTLLTLFDTMDEEAKTLATKGGAAAEAAREIAANVATMRDVVQKASRNAEQ